MHGCQRPLKLTDFVAHPGVLVSIASVQPGIFLELLSLIKNVSVEAEQAVFVAPNEEILEAAHLCISFALAEPAKLGGAVVQGASVLC